MASGRCPLTDISVIRRRPVLAQDVQQGLGGSALSRPSGVADPQTNRSAHRKLRRTSVIRQGDPLGRALEGPVEPPLNVGQII
jgi:hypothetical protein